MIFTQFFDTVWNGECGEVLSSKEEIDSFIEQFVKKSNDWNECIIAATQTIYDFDNDVKFTWNSEVKK